MKAGTESLERKQPKNENQKVKENNVIWVYQEHCNCKRCFDERRKREGYMC